MEIWKELILSPLRTISVSSLGQVRLASGKLTFGTNSRGYRSVYLAAVKGAVPKVSLVHRLVALAFLPNPLALPHINHLDGAKSNNRIENLEWCDQKMNAQHAHRTGLTTNFGDGHWTRKEPERVRRGATCNLTAHQFIGERHPAAKLSEQDAKAIREARANGAKLRELALKYGVCESTVCAIARNRRWSHVS